MAVPLFPFRYCLGGAKIFPRHFPHPIPYILYRSVGWQLWDIFCPWLTFFWLKRRRAFTCHLLKADRVSPLSSWLCRTLLSQTRLAFRASPHSSSNQGFDFLGIVVALGMLQFEALVMISTKQCKGSASSRMSSVMPSKHRSRKLFPISLGKHPMWRIIARSYLCCWW